jgi:LysR family transcriptional activator of nhaA
VKKYKRGFPGSINGAPCLLPGAHATVRRALDQWFESEEVRPALVAEFDDSALMYAFGEEGKGIFPSPTVFEAEFRKRYNVLVVGRVPTVRQHFYAISVDRRIQHPAVMAIVKAARQAIFK